MIKKPILAVSVCLFLLSCSKSEASWVILDFVLETGDLALVSLDHLEAPDITVEECNERLPRDLPHFVARAHQLGIPESAVLTESYCRLSAGDPLAP